VNLATSDRLPPQSRTPHNKKALEDYVARLSAFMLTTSGQHLCRPSKFDIDSPIVVVALGGINDMAEADVLPYISMATALTTSAALTFKCVNVVIDEFSNLAKYDCLMTAAGGYFSGGRKQGISVQGIGQDRESIAKGLNSSKVLDNIQHWQIARITATAARALADPNTGIGVPLPLFNLVDEDSPLPSRYECFSRWVVKSDGRVIVGRLPISFFVMAISVNEQFEIAERQTYLDLYPDDRLMGYIEYGKYLRSKTADATVL
jgi:hypothetical protein